MCDTESDLRRGRLGLTCESQALSTCKQKDATAGQGPENEGILVAIYSCITIHGGIPPPSPQLWLTFAPIPNFTAEFYNVSEDDVNLFSLVFFVVSLVIGLFSIVVLDTWGLKVSVRSVFFFFPFVLLPLSFPSSLFHLSCFFHLSLPQSPFLNLLPFFIQVF